MSPGENTSSNHIGGDVSGVSIQAREITGDISVTQMVGGWGREDLLSAGELSVATPEVVTVRRIHGRDELLAKVMTVVDGTGGQIVLCGAGGYGKSSVAYTVASEVCSRRTVWWVDATDRETLTVGLFEVAVQAGVSREEARQVWRNGESATDLLWRALDGPAAGPWLLVVDNADDPAVLDRWVRNPVSQNTVLVTSRDQKPSSWHRDALVYSVEPISDSDGAAVLVELAPDAGSESDARSLARRLGGIPIALTLVGKYLARTSANPVLPESRTPTSFADYEQALDTEFPTAISRLADRSDQVSLSGIWERSLDLLERNGVAVARPLVRLLAFFAASSLPVTVLRASVLSYAPSLFADVETIRLEAAVADLVGLGLLRYDRRSVGALALHPLIREIVRIQPDAIADAPLYRTLRITLLWATVQELDAQDHRTWLTWRLLLPHCTFGPSDIQYAAEDEYLLHSDVAFHAAQYTTRAGLWVEAERYYQAALTLRGKRGVLTDADAAAIRHGLAYLKRDQGRLAEAESDFREILTKYVDVFGADNPNMLATRHELARILYEKGDVDFAEREFDLLVSEMTRVLGVEHEYTLAARHEHARALRDQGLLDAALAEFESVSMTATKASGAASSTALNARHELAVLLRRRGELARARAEFSAVLEIERQTLGSEHPSTLVTRVDVAQVRADQGEFDAIEDELREVVMIWSRMGFADHPHALVASNTLAVVMMVRGSFAAAEVELRRVVAVATDVYGAGHMQTLEAHENLVLAIQQQGKLVEAEAELRRLLATMDRVLGALDQMTIFNRCQLADVLHRTGQFAAAAAEFVRVVKARTQLLGPDHPDTVDARCGLGAMSLMAGDAATARDELASVVAVVDNVFGVADHRSMAARLNFAQASGLLGDVPTAVRELQHILATCRGADGSDEMMFLAGEMLRQFER